VYAYIVRYVVLHYVMMRYGADCGAVLCCVVSYCVSCRGMWYHDVSCCVVVLCTDAYCGMTSRCAVLRHGVSPCVLVCVVVHADVLCCGMRVCDAMLCCDLRVLYRHVVLCTCVCIASRRAISPYVMWCVVCCDMVCVWYIIVRWCVVCCCVLLCCYV